MTKIQKAEEFAEQIYKGHKRLSGESYFEHSQRVYKELKNYGVKDEVTLVAALLHNCLDFSNEVEQEIENNFGKDILAIVKSYKSLSDKKIEINSLGEFNEKYIMQTFINMSADIRTLAIRLADKVDNLKNSWVLSKEKRIKRKGFVNFIEYVLFHPQAFSIVSAMSFVMAFVVCLSVTLIGYFFDILFLTITFGILTAISIWNLWRFRNMFKVFLKRKGKEDEYIQITIADTLNVLGKARDEIPDNEDEEE